jgi:hypothetical protein
MKKSKPARVAPKKGQAMKELLMMRQGDVLVQRVGNIPKAAKAIRRDAGRVILAYGEVTGHAHAIAEPECELLETDNERFLKVLGREIPAIRCRNTVTGQLCWIPMGAAVAAYKDLAEEGPEVIEGVVLRHEEHMPFVIPSGDYQVGGEGIRTQREYSPEAIRSVQD